jgi:hypothetical protein
MEAEDIFEIGEGEWLEARVRRDLGGIFPGSHGNFPKKTPLFQGLRHEGGDSRWFSVRKIKPRPRD